MDFNESFPIYMQVCDDLKGKIIAGEIKPGDKLPSSRELALRYKINPNTAARVYSELEGQHITETRRGIGTFVTEDKNTIDKLRSDAVQNVIENYLADMASFGFDEKEAGELLNKRVSEGRKNDT